MRIEIPEKKKLIHEMSLPIRWVDMDVMGHVNNAVYFSYMEAARVEWLRSVGVHTLLPGGQGMVIVNAFCSFHRELEYPGDVRLRMYASDPGRSSFETWVTMARGDAPETPCATGGATVVWVDTVQRKALPLPDWLRAHLV